MQAIDEDAELVVRAGPEESLSTSSGECIVGVVFGKTVRSSFASLQIAVLDLDEEASASDYANDDEDELEHVSVRLQFPHKDIRSLRSYCRRFFKLGDLVRMNGTWTPDDGEWQARRFVVEVPLDASIPTVIRVETVRYWNIQRCQKWQQEHLMIRSNRGRSAATTNEDARRGIFAGRHPAIEIDSPSAAAVDCPHGTAKNGLAKRQQGEYVANFLVHITMSKLANRAYADPSKWATSKPWEVDRQLYHRAIELLCSGSGVIDAAGGSGHVSLALGMMGVRSTVVDPRKSAGRLPGRDRKIWNRILKRNANLGATDSSTSLICEPVQYDTMRAWFGSRPDGVDETFRQPDYEGVLPEIDQRHEAVRSCSAIVALHPDEATDAVVDTAVHSQVPFIVVPCCVFCRLFPNRRKTSTHDPVSTRPELLDYLASKHPSIRRATLPFVGANIALWSTF